MANASDRRQLVKYFMVANDMSSCELDLHAKVIGLEYDTHDLLNNPGNFAMGLSSRDKPLALDNVGGADHEGPE